MMSSQVLEEQHTSELAETRIRAAQTVQTDFAAIKLSSSWFGTRRAVSPEQKKRAADTFNAESEALSVGKRLIDTKHPTFRALTKIKNDAVKYWKGVTLPYPEPGIRLIKRTAIDDFVAKMDEYKTLLQVAVYDLDAVFYSLKRQAENDLGVLYDPADYPETLVGAFSIDYEFPAVDPPDYLMQLSPRLFRAEQERMQARFNEAVRLAEEAFLTELQDLVEHLHERLSGTADGKPKIFKDSAVQNLREFFELYHRAGYVILQNLTLSLRNAAMLCAGWRHKRCAMTSHGVSVLRRGSNR
jgi:hypothetical protein